MSEIAIREISPKDRYLLSSGHSTRPSVFPRCAPGVRLPALIALWTDTF